MYTLASAPFVANTTIASALVNADFNDLVNDANTPRPLTAGGTGGASQIAGWDGLTAQGVAVASAATINLDTATGPWLDITGAVAVTAVTLANGKCRLARATGAFVLTASATLIVNNSTTVNYTTSVGDLLVFTAEGGVIHVTTITGGSVPIATNAQALGGTLTTVSLSPANLAQERGLGVQPVNFGITATVNANALTVSLVAADGNAPSATDPVTVVFRNATAATGLPVARTITSATALTVAAAATMGVAANNTAFKLWVVLVDTGAGVVLGLVNTLSGTSIMALRPGIYSTTGTPANAAQVIYTAAAQASKAVTVIGWLEWSAGLVTAGQWATAPTTIKLWQPGDPLPGDWMGGVRIEDGSYATFSGPITISNAAMTTSQGTQLLASPSYSPALASNLLRVTGSLMTSSNAGTASLTLVGLFRDAITNSRVGCMSNVQSGWYFPTPINHTELAGATTSTQFKLRAGGNTSSSFYYNGNGSQILGGSANSFLDVQEIMA